MKKNDVFRWNYTQSYIDQHQDQVNAGTLYWCQAKIAVFDGVQLRDIYWHRIDGNTVNFRGDGHSWSPEQIDKEIEVSFVANLDDLEPLNDNPNFYDNVINLTHANSHSQLFIWQGQTRNNSAMINYYQNEIAKCQHEIQTQQSRIEYFENILTGLNNNNERVF